MDISVVAPVFNEEENIEDLYREIKEVLKDNYKEWEILFVEDGSEDDSLDKLLDIREEDSNVSVIEFRSNFGQTAALQAGINQAGGDVIATIDADLQNDPADIPDLVQKLKEGYDCVCGWRKERRDPFVKQIISTVGTYIQNLLLGSDIHDFGCTLKAFKKEAAKSLDLQGDMHRYIPPILKRKGYRVSEIPVNHRYRQGGNSSYGLNRIPRGFVDLINVWFWQKYSDRPLHIFGGLGIFSVLLGLIAGAYAIYMKIFKNISLSDSALPLLAVLLVVLGAQFFVSGLLGDILVKIYNRENENTGYVVKEVH